MFSLPGCSRTSGIVLSNCSKEQFACFFPITDRKNFIFLCQSGISCGMLYITFRFRYVSLFNNFWYLLSWREIAFYQMPFPHQLRQSCFLHTAFVLYPIYWFVCEESPPQSRDQSYFLIANCLSRFAELCLLIFLETFCLHVQYGYWT